MIRQRKGFTLIELLVVIAIIAILAAILFPVFMAARAKARQSTCMSNMNQIAKAFQMYTSDWEDRMPCTWCPTGGNVWTGTPMSTMTTNQVALSWCSRIDSYLKQGAVNPADKQLTGCFVCPEQEKAWAASKMAGVPDAQSYGYNFLFLGLPYVKDQTTPPPGHPANPFKGRGWNYGSAKVGRISRPSDTILIVENWCLFAYPPFDNAPEPAAMESTGNQYIRPRHSGKSNIAWCDGHTSTKDTSDLVTYNNYYGNETSKEVGRAQNNEFWDRL